MSLVRFGIVGTDGAAEKFYQANRFGQGFELTAVYDEDQERAGAFCLRKGKINVYDDLSAFTEAEDVDAVYISGPVSCHYEQAADAMKAGKHVLCRAPLTMDLSLAKKLFQIAEDNNVILMEAVPSVYTPAFQKMISHIRTLGRVRRATFQNCIRTPEYENYKRGSVSGVFDVTRSGGSLAELGTVPVSCMVRLFGRPKEIKALGVLAPESGDSEIRPDLSGSILFCYEDMIGEVLYSSISRQATASQIQGEEGSMLIREIENVKDLRIFRGKVNQTIHFEQSDNTLNHVTKAFMKAVRTGTTGTGWETARENTLETVRILEEADRQIRGTGR